MPLQKRHRSTSTPAQTTDSKRPPHFGQLVGFMSFWITPCFQVSELGEKGETDGSVRGGTDAIAFHRYYC